MFIFVTSPVRSVWSDRSVETDKAPILINVLSAAKLIVPVSVVTLKLARENESSVPLRITIPEPPEPAALQHHMPPPPPPPVLAVPDVANTHCEPL